MRETLQANTATIATLLSGSTNGYIGLVWTAAAYDIDKICMVMTRLACNRAIESS
jgi:hypothetical protein